MTPNTSRNSSRAAVRRRTLIATVLALAGWSAQHASASPGVQQLALVRGNQIGLFSDHFAPLVRLSAGQHVASPLLWSPNGRYLAFITYRSMEPMSGIGGAALHVLDVNQPVDRVVVRGSPMAANFQAVWSSSSHYLVLANNCSLVAVPTVGTQRVILQGKLGVNCLGRGQISGDGSTIAAAVQAGARYVLVKVDTASGHRTQVGTLPSNLSAGTGAISPSPHGDFVAFATSLFDKNQNRSPACCDHVWIAPLAPAGLSRKRSLGSAPLTQGGPSSFIWSPPAARLVHYDSSAPNDAWYPLGGGAIRHIPGFATLYAWSPDGQFLAYRAGRGAQNTAEGQVRIILVAQPGKPFFNIKSSPAMLDACFTASFSSTRELAYVLGGGTVPPSFNPGTDLSRGRLTFFSANDGRLKHSIGGLSCTVPPAWGP